jgi:hypothetical protein
VNFPVPTAEAVSDYGIQYARAGSVIREYDKGQAQESREFALTWNMIQSEEAGSLLSYILTQVRSSKFTINVGDSLLRMGLWEPRTGEELQGVYNIRIASELLEVVHVSGDLWRVSIRVRKEK